MIGNNWIQQQLNHYSECFDLYLERGDVPPPPPEGSSDPLQDYLQEALSEPFNYLHCQEDPIWRDIFKSSLMSFFSTMLSDYYTMEMEYQKEMNLIRGFFNAKLEQKRIQWNDVASAIQDKYPSDELNPFGYLSSLQQVDESQYEPIFEAMRQQWAQVAQERLRQEKLKMLSAGKRQFQIRCMNVGKEDYQTLLDSKQVLVRFPILKEIIDMIGRNKPNSKEEKDITITRYLPYLLSHSKAVAELDGVCLGNTIQQALPSELVYLSERDTEDVFFHRFATGQLQELAAKPPSVSVEKTEQKKSEKPRLIKGPIIVSVDTSGSMSGRPMNVANSLLLQLLQMARHQRRACFLITYSVRAKAIDLAHPANWGYVKKFLREGYTGGTDGNEMLELAINTLQSKTYSMADVLIISDFCWDCPETRTMQSMLREMEKGTKFYGLSIDNQYSADTHTWLNKIWNINLNESRVYH